MRSKFLKPALAVAAATAAVLGGGTFALASDSAPAGNVYSACVTFGHSLYGFTVNGTPKCFKGDTLISWNQTGPQGPRPAGSSPARGRHRRDGRDGRHGRDRAQG